MAFDRADVAFEEYEYSASDVSEMSKILKPPSLAGSASANNLRQVSVQLKVLSRIASINQGSVS